MRKSPIIFLTALICIVFLFTHNNSYAQYKLWVGITGGGDGSSWSNPLNWNNGTLPSTADSVLLDNSFVTGTYTVTLPGGTSNTQVAKIVILPTLPNFISLTLPSTNTSTNNALLLGNGAGSPYDFVLNKHAIFNYQTGATAGTPFALVNSSDSIQILDSAIWYHNCRVGQTGIVNKLSKRSDTKFGIFKYDMLTSSPASIQFQNITYGSIILSGVSSNAPYPGKKYITTGSAACNVRGNFYIDAACYDSTVMTNNLNIGGNFTMYGKLIYAPVASPRTLVFNGTTLQNITCGGPNPFNYQISGKVTFNNAAGFYIARPIYIDSVTMTNGNIGTADTACLGVGYDAANPGTLTRIGGVVTGKMIRWSPASVTSVPLSYPVGNGLHTATVSFSIAPSTAGSIVMEYFSGTGSLDFIADDGVDLPITLTDGDSIITRRSKMYWEISANGITGGALDLTFDGNGISGVTNSSDLRVIYSSDGGHTFSLQGNYTPGSGSIGKRNNVTNYIGRFYLAGNANNNPLPVELISFMATTIKNEVILDWVTGNETNNSGFEVERAAVANGITGEYIKVGYLISGENSTIQRSYKFIDKNLAPGKYTYRLKQIDFNGNFHYLNLNSVVNVILPNSFSVSQNYPNPFNPSTIITYEIPFDGVVNLTVFDNLGREVKTLLNGNINAGYHKAEFNAAGLPSGIYFYKINAISGSMKFEKILKMILVK
jgi:hypothetical protein